jgi:hypothetical protein
MALSTPKTILTPLLPKNPPKIINVKQIAPKAEYLIW